MVLETVKPAEESDDIILRFYEAHGMRTKASVTVDGGFANVTETDLMENDMEQVAVAAESFSFEIKPYEIKTFRLVRK